MELSSRWPSVRRPQSAVIGRGPQGSGSWCVAGASGWRNTTANWECNEWRPGRFVGFPISCWGPDHANSEAASAGPAAGGKREVWNTKATKGAKGTKGRLPFVGFVSFVVQMSARDPATPGGPEWGRWVKGKPAGVANPLF